MNRRLIKMKNHSRGGLYRLGGKMKYEHGGLHLDTDNMERVAIEDGLASSATPGGGVTLAFQEGTAGGFDTILKRFQGENPNLVNPQMDYRYLGDERVVYGPGEFDDKIVMEAHKRGVQHRGGDRQSDIFQGLMSEFDNYVSSFGDEVKNNPRAIARARENFMDQARNYASQVYDAEQRRIFG